MKYALNHPWKFERPILAFTVGLWQVTVVFIVELVNFVLVVGSNTHMNIVLGFLALIFIINYGNFFFQPESGNEFKRLISGLDDKYAQFLRIQLKVSPRYKIFKTHRQKVETIQPFMDEVDDDIPQYTKLTSEHRARWRCNRCLRVQYPIYRVLYLAFWFYYSPFLALTVNFTIPYLAEKLGDSQTITDPGEMSNEYEQWLQEQLESKANSSYEEPPVDELVAMMEALPKQKDDWIVSPEILVAPLSMEQYWDCFWSNEAPYYI